MRANDTSELLRYFAQAIKDAKSFLWLNYERLGIEIIREFIPEGLPEKKLDKLISKFPMEIPELRTLFKTVEKVELEWNLKDFIDRFSSIGKIDIPDLSVMTKNINDNSEYYWILDIESKTGELKFYSDLDISKKDLKEFKKTLPKIYYFDVFADADAYTVLWFNEDKYGLAIVTDQGSKLEILPWSIAEYLTYLVQTLGLRYWQEIFLKRCEEGDFTCLIKEVLKDYDYTKENEESLLKLFEEYHQIVGHVPSVLLKSYINLFGKTENLDKVRELVEREGADPNVRFGDFNTPLTRAARVNDFALINLLLDLGANPDLRNAEGQSPLDILLNRSKIDVPTLIRLVKGGASLTPENVSEILSKKVITRKKYAENPDMKILIEKMIELGENLDELIEAIRKIKDEDLLSKAEARKKN
ncbi:MAG: hypothetical protein GXO48_06805 [Chlorobi bacterium]|nr:hypothetical protein [Chlorobiota bacterium]